MIQHGREGQKVLDGTAMYYPSLWLLPCENRFRL